MAQANERFFITPSNFHSVTSVYKMKRAEISELKISNEILHLLNLFTVGANKKCSSTTARLVTQFVEDAGIVHYV